MDQEAAFLQAALPEPVTLLHQQLLPYSLGHDIILHRHRSPFAGKARDRMPTLDDLFAAVLVCANSYDDAIAELRLPMPEWNKRMKKWVALVNDDGPITELQALEIMIAFQRYIADGSRCPKFREIIRTGQGARRQPGAPWHVLLFNTLTGDLNCSRTEALNCPLGEAQWRYCAWLERKGAIRITPSTDAEELKAIRAEAEKLGWQPMKFAPGAIVVSAEQDAKLRHAEAAPNTAAPNPESPNGP